MTAEVFVSWAETLDDGERYELVEGQPVRLQSEKVSHARHKASAWLALRNAVRAAGSDCEAFPDGVSIRVNERTVREPDALVHCGPYDGAEVFVSNPVIVLEVVSPSSARDDSGRKLIDYFSVSSIQHYLILYGDEQRVVHHRRTSVEGEIATRIVGRDDVLDLSPPGISVSVDRLFDS
ncbi:hypothetical protein ASG54_09990 [Aureimonas sp. Leaf460]|nr:hypothetical protein ASG62_07390 [Aureimonas sp. Leaf427]KQT79342.1 hypothetical protein ASG54_09990 [Aureimonas sp. Leaf460]